MASTDLVDAEDSDEEVDSSKMKFHIELVMKWANVNRHSAKKAFIKINKGVVNSIMDLTLNWSFVEL